jgi:hypothetical protein
MGVNLSSGLAFFVAMSGFVVVHHDLLHKFHKLKAKIALFVMGPIIGFWGVYAVLGAIADNTAGISQSAYYLNLALGILGGYCIAFRPFRNGEQPRGANGAK